MGEQISLVDICGNRSRQDLFWDTSLTLNSSSPDLTRCFQQTVFVWVPCAWLWGSAFIYFLILRRRDHLHTKTSSFNRIKTIINILFVAVTSLNLWKSINDVKNGDSLPPVYFVTPGILMATMVLVSIWTPYEYKKGVHSGPVPFIYWLLLLVFGIVTLRSIILQAAQDAELDLYRSVVFCVYYCLVIVQFLLHLFSDTSALREGHVTNTEQQEKQPLLSEVTDDSLGQKKGDTKVCPELSASFPSRSLYLWMTKMVIKGYKKTLTFSDLWQLNPEDTCKEISLSFESNWQKELNKIFIKPKSQMNGPTAYKNGMCKPQKQLTYIQACTATDGDSPSLLAAIGRTFGPYYVLGGFYRLLYDLIGFVNPVLLSALITFIGSGDVLAWHGYALAVSFFVISSIRTVIGQAYWNVCFKTGMRLRTAMIGAVYKKAIRLSSATRRTTTVGEIVNLMSVDAQKFQESPTYLHMVWSAPFIIALSLYFLWQQLGPSVLAGFGIMLLLVPVNAYTGTVIRKLQISQMTLKDNRIKVLNEVLNGIKVLKLYAWEDSFIDKLIRIRESENRSLMKSGYVNAIGAVSWTMAPYLVSLGSFAVYVLSSPENVLDANKAFVSLSLFGLMRYPMSILPTVVMFAAQTSVSLKRIQRFLIQEELESDNVTEDPLAEDAVKIDSGTFSWGESARPALKNINLQIPKGSLVAIVGSVGSGKSSLVSAMLGELEVLAGTTTISGSRAYVPQQAWILNATLRDNITFEKKFDERRYKKVIDACALGPDLENLAGGDMIEIGEKGINLSGGQKQRVSLGRAVYQNADIYILDDPLSAVDAHVGKHIFEHVVGPVGLLKNKTRILVTNTLAYLDQTDHVIVLRDGKISETGKYDDLLESRGAFAELIQTYLNETEDQEETDSELADMNSKLRRQFSSLSEHGLTTDTEEVSPGYVTRKKRRSQNLLKRQNTEAELPAKTVSATHRLTEEELAKSGAIKLGVVKTYLRACGVGGVALVVSAYALNLIVMTYTNIWLSSWSSDKPINGTQNLRLRDLRLGVYGGLGILQAMCVVTFSIFTTRCCVMAARNLHTHILRRIMRAPMSFFDTTPLGRIANRFSRDIDTIDNTLPLTLRVWMSMVVNLVQIFVTICYSTPIFLSIVVPIVILYFFIQRFYICCSRQLQRIESIRRSPIFAHFSETLTGLSSVRAYQVQERFILESEQRVDKNQMAYHTIIMSARWLGIWLETLGNFVVLFASIFAVISRETLTAGLAGLSVNFSLQATVCLNLFVRMACDLEAYIVAVERIQEYMHCPQEAPAEVEGNRLRDGWPDAGVVKFDEYSTRYRPGLELVLKRISMITGPGEKIGIVGRTGAGKSSMTLGLFRIIESAGGCIKIDDVTIDKIGLKELRSKLTIIPQDPVIFSGTLRMNLDPFERHHDDEIWKALQQAHLSTFIASLSDGLGHECGEGGENLSVGQRQLVCLARALLRKTRILVLDEATAAIDLETDDLIQTTIREEFKECTVITIAHRINTIMDYDRVVVLDAGEIAEFDPPAVLLQNKSNVFYKMARDAGLV